MSCWNAHAWVVEKFVDAVHFKPPGDAVGVVVVAVGVVVVVVVVVVVTKQ